MTTTADTAPTGTDGSGGVAGGERQSAPVGGAINRLNAFDGLFLRAEHLTQIQDYARALAYAAGQAAGHGVVYGYDVSVQGDELRVGPGLAINPQGRPLKSDQVATVSLAGLVPQKDGYWIVEIIADSTAHGDETVFGLLCDDPCSGGSTMRPFVSEGIRIQLSPRAEEGLDALLYPGHRRGWLASRLFERERRDGGPWLTPTNGGSVPPLSSRPWNTGAPRPVGETVAVAVLLLSSDDWEVDTWTARRELGDPSPRRVWQWRLGMRPWDVFVAQVLQFQDLLTARYLLPDGLTGAMLLRHVEEQLDYAIVKVRERKQREPLEVLHALRSAVGGKLAVVPAPLPDLGISELPPAGYLPMAGLDSVEDQVAALLGPNIDARFCRCRPDYVPHAVEDAQHMDRIPLDNPDLPSAIDILVPVPDEGEISPASTAYGWIAFVRRREVDCGPPPTDEVDVYTVDNDEEDAVLNSVKGGVVPDIATFIATAKYPPGTWAVPPPPAFELLRDALRDVETITLFALASTEDRRSLAAVRAALLLAPFDDDSVSFELRTAVVPAGQREAIVAVLGVLDRDGGIDEDDGGDEGGDGVLNVEKTRPAQPGIT
jgi:hypothetical protein